MSGPKTILLLRHGKSDWNADLASDHQRPLAERGVRAAQQMGQWLTQAGQAPDLVLTSDAERARRTSELAAEAGQWQAPIELRPEFYGAEPETLLRALRGLGEETATVVLTGHQPTWSQTVALLAGGGRVHFPTAALACLEYLGDWPGLSAGRCELRWLVTPKLLARAD